MKRLPVSYRREFFRAILDETFDLLYNRPRRLRNALLALSLADPHWLTWVEDNLPNDLQLCQSATYLTMIEARARHFVLKPYGFFHRQNIADLIFAPHWPFNDHGRLTPG